MSRVLLQREIASKANGFTIRTQRVRALKYGMLDRITVSRVRILRLEVCNLEERHFLLEKDVGAPLCHACVRVRQKSCTDKKLMSSTYYLLSVGSNSMIGKSSTDAPYK